MYWCYFTYAVLICLHPNVCLKHTNPSISRMMQPYMFCHLFCWWFLNLWLQERGRGEGQCPDLILKKSFGIRESFWKTTDTYVVTICIPKEGHHMFMILLQLPTKNQNYNTGSQNPPKSLVFSSAIITHKYPIHPTKMHSFP